MKWATKFRWVGMAALALAAALPCWSTQAAVLRNGFSIRHERRENLGAVTRLYVTRDGSSYVDVPTADIDHFEDALAEPSTAVSASRAPASNSVVRASASPGVQTAKRVFSQTELSSYVTDSSGRYRLDPDLVSSVIKAESGFNVGAVSRKGAQGLMQLTPQTASQLGVADTFDPQANVEGGTRYLRELLERYNFDLIKALAAYNAGPQRVEQFGGVPPYTETRAYVARIVKDFNKKKLAQKNAQSKTSVAKANKPPKSAAKPNVVAKSQTSPSQVEASLTGSH